VVIGDGFTEPVSSTTPTASTEGDGGGRRTPASMPAVRSESQSSYEGIYYSDEIDATFKVSVKDGALMLQRDSDPQARALDPAADGAFRFSGMNVRFERADDGSVGALVVDAGRVRDIRFTRTTR
jgi:hypothetical protein